MNRARPPLPAAEVRDNARRQAEMVRGNWMMMISQGIVSPTEVVCEAAKPEGAPLLKLKLHQLLLAQPDCSLGKATARLSQALRVSSARSKPTDRPTVAWLLDRRSGGRRFAAWLDSETPKQGPPVEGFPFRLHDRGASHA